MKLIRFDLSCLKSDFQDYIFKSIGCNDYYDFINKYQNNFTLNLLNIEEEYQNEPEIDQCTFKNITNISKIDESNVINVEANIEYITEVIKPSMEPTIVIEQTTEQNIENNIDKIISKIDSENDSDDEEDEKIDIQFSHYIENGSIYLIPNKKFIPKSLSKTIKKNGGNWIKSKNIWIFPLSSKHYVENILGSQNTNNYIKNISHEKDRVIIEPKIGHSKYGTSVIYDKTGNIGLWDSALKAWVFNKRG